jgi:hypothetical protein
MHKVGFFRRAPVRLSPSIAVLPGKDKITHSSISPTRIFLIALSRHHPRLYCPSAEKDGVCMQVTRAKRRTAEKSSSTRQVPACPHPGPRTKRPSKQIHGVMDTRAVSSVPRGIAPPGHSGRAGSPPFLFGLCTPCSLYRDPSRQIVSNLSRLRETGSSIVGCGGANKHQEGPTSC